MTTALQENKTHDAITEAHQPLLQPLNGRLPGVTEQIKPSRLGDVDSMFISSERSLRCKHMHVSALQ